MRNWDTRDETPGSPCPSDQDFKDAQQVCDMLDIPVEKMDLSKEYWTWVFEDFLSGLESGETPNPDVACNRHIKFDAFLKRIWECGKRRESGVDGDLEWIATGHYAQVDYVSRDSARLMKAVDDTKDQTYYLSNVSSYALSKSIFPVGYMRKSEVKALASRLGFPTAVKKESMGICFVGKRDFGDFVGDYIESEGGPIVSIDGKRMGEHRGLARYTIGQGAKISGETEK
ncbi:hypothetical protein HDU97_007058 [Phlyctochytrium planicorne]|nr:hypothetical protein HDU97_007058 [Phlyctochytrium planicorne]